MLTRTLQLLILMTSLTFSAAWAEETPPVSNLLGAGIWLRPAYDGADERHAALIPVVRYYGQPWFARTTFGMLEGGARVELLSGFTVGGQVAYEGGRDRSESAFLHNHNVPDLSPSLSAGVHAELEKKIGIVPVIALLRYRQDLDSARGAQTDLRLTVGVYGDAKLNAGVFVQTTWADTASAQYYYGLTAPQAASTGLPAYKAQGGALFDALGFLWSYELDRKWMLLGSVETRNLRGDARSSPLQQSDIAQYASLGLAYQF